MSMLIWHVLHDLPHISSSSAKRQFRRVTRLCIIIGVQGQIVTNHPTNNRNIIGLFISYLQATLKQMYVVISHGMITFLTAISQRYDVFWQTSHE